MKFEIFEGKDGKHYFKLAAENGQTVLKSQGYASKASCKNGIESVRANGQDEAQFDKKIAKNGKDFFNLLAKNKQIIGTSQMYASKQSMENGIKSVARLSKDAPIVEVEN